jgi:linoleoyl-CoA desaturase
MGIGMAGVNVMHDGNHGSYSNKSWVNKFMGGTIYVLAGNVYNWQVQHILHHTYTNIPGHDEDLDAGRVIRFTKAKWYNFHRFQQYYSVFLWIIDFQLGYHNRFQTDEKLLEENYRTAKLKAQNFGLL